MKKFMKGCAITAAVLCLSGLLLAVAGGTARGSEAISEVVQRVTGGRVSVNFDDVKDWGIMIHDNIGNIASETDWGVNYDINEHTMFAHSQKIYKGDVSRYCPGTEIKNLDIEVGGCVLEIKSSYNQNFYIEVTKAYKFQGYVEDDTLYIKASNGAKTWDKMGSCTITLYVPEHYRFMSVDVALGAGAVSAKISDLLAMDHISLEVGAGAIEIDNLRTSKLYLEIGAGEIELGNMEVWNELSAEVGMGNLEAQGAVWGDADIQCSMGNVDLELAGGGQDYNYNLECAMGKIVIGNYSYSGLAKEKRIDNGAGSTIGLQCAMGNISVSFGNQTTYVTEEVIQMQQW